MPFLRPKRRAGASSSPGISPDVFEAIYRAHVDRVYAVCLRATQDEARAEAATQEVFVRAWKAYPRFEGRAKLGTWLHQIARNVLIDDHRRRARRAEAPLEAVEPRAPDVMKAREEAVDLERAIARLPERARLVFVLHDIEGHRHNEIADALGVHPGTCKAQLFRARRLLREALS